jgi:ribonuclease HI
MCNYPIDNLDHYLYHCPALAEQRSIGCKGRWFTHGHHYNQCPNPDHAIIAFTDGSWDQGKRAGAGVVISFPPRYGYLDNITNIINSTDLRINTIDRSDHGFWVDKSMSISNGTNNIGELYAIALAVQIISQNINYWYAHDGSAYLQTCPIIICTDSKYVQGVLAHGHMVKENHDVIRHIHNQLQQLTSNGRRHIIIHWVKAHSDISGNEHADKLAGDAMKSCNNDGQCPSPPTMDNISYDMLNLNVADPLCIRDLLGIYRNDLGVTDVDRILNDGANYIGSLMKKRAP